MEIGFCALQLGSPEGLEVNFVRGRSLSNVSWRYVVALCVLSSTTWHVLLICGCSDNVQSPSIQEMATFQDMGPARPSVDLERLIEAKIPIGPHHVVPGEVLQLAMPTVLQIVTAEERDPTEKVAPYICRVNSAGTITLPVIGEITAAGRSLTEIETAIVTEYYPAYANTRPSVYAEVIEPITYRVSVTGAVSKPGLYKLQGEQMSLVALLMEAGGIVDKGAAVIRIKRASHALRIQSHQLSGVLGQGPAHRFANARKSSRETLSFAAFSQSDNSDVRLSFQPDARSASIGHLTIWHKGKGLIDKRINLASASQRFTAASDAVGVDPSLSMVDLTYELAALAGLPRESALPGHLGLQLASAVQPSSESTPKRLDFLDAPAEYEPEGDPGMSAESQGPDRQDLQQANTIVLPVKGLTVPFADVTLYEGDRVVVERLIMPRFTVLGLVKTPGTFEYPPDAGYTLIEVIGLAGGLDQVADPRYATVYRLQSDGTVAHRAINIKDIKEAHAQLSPINVRIKPGDVVAVEHTARTRSNVFLERVFRINIGAYVPLGDLYDDD